jgi:hypothetical protein
MQHTMNKNIGYVPDWFDQFRAEHTLQLRPEIVRLVNAHCYRTGKSHQEVWRSVYAKLGIALPSKDKLAYVEAQGHIGALYNIVLSL